MSIPAPMDCISDQCRSPLACSGFGYCRERDRAGAREYDESIKACRELGIMDPFRKQLGDEVTTTVDLPPRARAAIREEASIADGGRFGDGDWHG